MSTPCRRRLLSDYKRLKDGDSSYGIWAEPNPDNILFWTAVILGPPETPYEEGVFKLKLEFREDYPARAPNVTFVSKMFHPNVYDHGGICLDILHDRWSSAYDVAALLTSIQSLLNDPNISSPANGEAANLYSHNPKEYRRKVRKTVEASWIED